jgi:saccharopine dehydrogenase-like NADP-dependent oxidoreductase
MKTILLIGAGRSASSLISYLLNTSSSMDWKVTVADFSYELAEKKVNGHPQGRALAFDVNNAAQRKAEIGAADIVISLLPPALHYLVAEDCVTLRKHLVTASYVSPEIKELDARAKEAGVLLLNEIGLDPGIDHMSAMEIIDRIKHEGGHIISFRSYCGGLMEPESGNNPWGYKFTWNPRNVVVAGQGTAKYQHEGRHKYLPYSRLFLQTEQIEVPGHGMFEAYANRDSLSYREPYGLGAVPGLLRGTLRMPGYCKAWHVFVKLGITDDSYIIEDSEHLTYADFIRSYLPSGMEDMPLRTALAAFMGTETDTSALDRVEWLGLLEPTPIELCRATPAQILQHLLEEKWRLQPGDKDMIVMQHQFVYTVGNLTKELRSSMIVKGEDEIYTAMAKTVGLPAAIAAKLILMDKISLTGVHIPTDRQLYHPVLEELKEYGITFTEEERTL